MTKQFVLITGVSSGLGLATAQLLLERGFHVFGSVRKISDAVKLTSQWPDTFTPLVFDVTDRKSIEDNVHTVKNTLQGQLLTALVNNAGISIGGPLMHIPEEEFIYGFNVNVFGLLRVTQVFLPLLGAYHGHGMKPGKIINISSVSALTTTPFLAGYSASKKAVEALTEGLRRELSIYGIDAVSIQPSSAKSDIWDKARRLDIYPDTDYHPYLKKLPQMLDDIEKSAFDAKMVGECVYKIITSKRPKTKQVVSNKPLMFKIVKRIPPRMLDWITKRNMDKMTR